MKRLKSGHTVLAEAGIFNAVGLSRWAKSRGFSDYYLVYRVPMVGGREPEWVVFSEKKWVRSVTCPFSDKKVALRWAIDWSAYSLGVDAWGRIEGLTELYPYETLKKFKVQYPESTISKVKVS